MLLQVGQICVAGNSGLRGEFVKYRSECGGCDDFDEHFEVANAVSAGDERVVEMPTTRGATTKLAVEAWQCYWARV